MHYLCSNALCISCPQRCRCMHLLASPLIIWPKTFYKLVKTYTIFSFHILHWTNFTRADKLAYCVQVSVALSQIVEPVRCFSISLSICCCNCVDLSPFLSVFAYFSLRVCDWLCFAVHLRDFLCVCVWGSKLGLQQSIIFGIEHSVDFCHRLIE